MFPTLVLFPVLILFLLISTWAFVFKNNATVVAQIDGAGNVFATSYTGNGANLTNIGAAALADDDDSPLVVDRA